MSRAPEEKTGGLGMDTAWRMLAWTALLLVGACGPAEESSSTSGDGGRTLARTGEEGAGPGLVADAEAPASSDSGSWERVSGQHGATGPLPSDDATPLLDPDSLETPVSHPPASDPSCPADMAGVLGFCIDRFEAPNRALALPLIMYTMVEAEGWCSARGKRLCFDDEWTLACQGDAGGRYPYGDPHEPGRCNDDRTWRAFDQTRLDDWPRSASAPDVESWEHLLLAASQVSERAAESQRHVAALYQADAAGARAGCVGSTGVYDLCGNVEEWTRRREGGSEPGFSGYLKGRYWAEARSCTAAVSSHGDYFRFYQLGFRCCTDRQSP